MIDRSPVIDTFNNVYYYNNMPTRDFKQEIHRQTGYRFAQGGNDIYIYFGNYGLADGYTLQQYGVGTYNLVFSIFSKYYPPHQ